MKLNVTFFNETDQRFKMSMQDAVVTEVVGDVEYYEGSYEVTPKVKAQTVPTAQKYLTADMTVKAIPYSDTSNTAGGRTIYIAEVL